MKNTSAFNAVNSFVRSCIMVLCLLTASTQWSWSQSSASVAPVSKEEQQVIDLSKEKWQWMADKNVDKLAKLFHDKSKFVHMSGTWNRDRELEIIKTGSIWYKNAEVHDVVVEIFNGTVILWNRITLQAVVRGNEVSTEFTVTEIYKTHENSWQLLGLTFSSVRDTHQIED